MMRLSLSFLFVLTLCGSCKEEVKNVLQEPFFMNFRGETMGTYYTIKFYSRQSYDFQPKLDSILSEIYASVNTYVPSSLISKFNELKSVEPFSISDYPPVIQNHFIENWEISQHIWKLSDHYFDPTVMELVNYWGFGYQGRHKVSKIDSLTISKLASTVGLEKIIFTDRKLIKDVTSIEIDFSGVAKGYAIDVIGQSLKELGITNYYVEIGGEVKASGNKENNSPWTIGISSPDPDAPLTDITRVYILENMSVATSGNYRNYYKIDNCTVSHTINPKTGYPEQTELLSATIFQKECGVADALATACMSMGKTRCIEMLDQIDDTYYLLLYLDNQGQVQEVASAAISKWKK